MSGVGKFLWQLYREGELILPDWNQLLKGEYVPLDLENL